jgi:hypothetical protein
MRFLLMPKGIPRASDAAELAASGVKNIETLFAGAIIVVESQDDLRYTLDPAIWVVEEERASAVQNLPSLP